MGNNVQVGASPTGTPLYFSQEDFNRWVGLKIIKKYGGHALQPYLILRSHQTQDTYPLEQCLVIMYPQLWEYAPKPPAIPTSNIAICILHELLKPLSNVILQIFKIICYYLKKKIN